MALLTCFVMFIVSLRVFLQYECLLVVTPLLCNVTGQTYDKPEGSPCEWENARGTCISARRCESFFYDRMTNIQPPICSFEGKEPIVCCTDCEFLSEESSYKDVLDRDYYKTDRKYEKKCFEYQYLLPYKCNTQIQYKHTRIYNATAQCYGLFAEAFAPVGGEDAFRGDFPHMALLGYGPDLESAQWLCGGSLISERFILTAGHCASSAQLGAVRYVALGMLKRSDPPHYWKRYKVKKFIPHPDYHSPIKYNDIALIETEVTLEKFTPEECAALYPQHRHLPQGYNISTQICYGDHKEVRDTCQGDSGGPLQKRDPDARYCPYVIIGVTSYGRECGQPGVAGVYTRVHHYLPWIESVVWP